MARIFYLTLTVQFLLGAAAGTNCGSLIGADVLESIKSRISSEPVVVFGIENARCTIAAIDRLNDLSICFDEQTIGTTDTSLWDYFKCKHPGEDYLGQQMHSYVYIGGSFIGNGFALLADLNDSRIKPGTLAIADAALLSMATDARGQITCERDCSSLASADKIFTLEAEIAKRQSVVLYGWAGCPCTKIAEDRFKEAGLCFVEYVWPEPQNDIFKYLQCVHGTEHHSFIWFDGTFRGDGFGFAADRLDTASLNSMIAEADGRRTCVEEGELALTGEALMACTQPSDETTTGWLRTGSCNWDASDGGYHEVCVTMSDEFLASSARDDANDLRSVVQSGGHWCICAWAFASAVVHDPQQLQGIELSCDRTNERLREVYQHYIDEGKKLRSPSGRSYEADVALAKLEEICGSEKMVAAASFGASHAALSSPATAVAAGASYAWEDQVDAAWAGATVAGFAAAREALHSKYSVIFPHGNRNAASHRWSTYILQYSSQMAPDRFEFLFSAFCAVSGSPIAASDGNRFTQTLPTLDTAGGTDAGTYTGYMYYCCQPCFCDSRDELRVDTRSVAFVDGSVQTYRFVVIENPCKNPDVFTEEYVDAFGRGMSTLAADAPDVTCTAEGALDHGTRSDHGRIIVGMIYGPGTGHWDANQDVPSVGADELEGYCADRSESGFASGMGAIFRRVAEAGASEIDAAVAMRKRAAVEPAVQFSGAGHEISAPEESESGVPYTFAVVALVIALALVVGGGGAAFLKARNRSSSPETQHLRTN